MSLFIGVAYGAVAGYAGGKVDGAMMRLVDILYALPSLIYVIVLIAAFEQPLSHFFAGSPEIQAQARLLLLFVGLGCVEWLTMRGWSGARCWC